MSVEHAEMSERLVLVCGRAFCDSVGCFAVSEFGEEEGRISNEQWTMDDGVKEFMAKGDDIAARLVAFAVAVPDLCD